MKQRHHTLEQVIRKLAEGDKLLNEGQDLAEVCRHLTSIHRGADVKHRISREFRDWDIFGGVLVDHLSGGRGESHSRSSL